MEHREQQIIRVSIIGIITNIILAGFKFVVGMLANSVAIMIDALNNASDVLSSVITVIGTKLAGRPADKTHPYGHGRVEYITAEVISAIVLYAGITALIESVKKLITPEEPEYSTATLVVVAAGVIVKFVLGRYVSSKGSALSSDALTDSGKDALMDSAVSAATLLGAFVFLGFGVNLEAWLGAFISIIIIKAGIDMFSETTSKILGERVESEISTAIKETICETEGVFGAYDLILTNYGPDRLMGSVHVEVPDNWTADKIDVISREISHKVYTKHHVALAAIGIYSRNLGNNGVMRMQERITEAVMSQKYVLQIHGFYCGVKERVIRFDIVIDFAAPDAQEVQRNVMEAVKKLYPAFSVTVQPDSDFSD
ncbi:MAG: cation transporter [Synergistaceae bacterium]|nr:cation transporter [Synergistaceae bacterium]